MNLTLQQGYLHLLVLLHGEFEFDNVCVVSPFCVAQCSLRAVDTFLRCLLVRISCGRLICIFSVSNMARCAAYSLFNDSNKPNKRGAAAWNRAIGSRLVNGIMFYVQFGAG